MEFTDENTGVALPSPEDLPTTDPTWVSWLEIGLHVKTLLSELVRASGQTFVALSNLWSFSRNYISYSKQYLYFILYYLI